MAEQAPDCAGGDEEPDSDVEDTLKAGGAGQSSPSASKFVGRRKTVCLIPNERHRAVTFTKRKGGLIKKAAELSILCGAEVAVIVAGRNQKMTIFSSKPFDQVMEGLLEKMVIFWPSQFPLFPLSRSPPRRSRSLARSRQPSGTRSARSQR